MTDVDGNVFLDLSAGFGAAAVNPPPVTAAIGAQAGRLLHGMGDVHPPAVKVELLRALARVCPGDLNQAILAGSGAESIEAALKTTVLATGRAGVIAFEGSYHGLTYGALAATSRDDFRRPFRAQLGHFVHHAPYPQRPDEAARCWSGSGGCPPPDPAGGCRSSNRSRARRHPCSAAGVVHGCRRYCHRHGALLFSTDLHRLQGTGRWFARCRISSAWARRWAGLRLPRAPARGDGRLGQSTGRRCSTFWATAGCAAALAIAVLRKSGWWSGRRHWAVCARAWRHFRLAAVQADLMWGPGSARPGRPTGSSRPRGGGGAAPGIILLPAGRMAVLELVPPTPSPERLQFALDVLRAVL